MLVTNVVNQRIHHEKGKDKPARHLEYPFIILLISCAVYLMFIRSNTHGTEETSLVGLQMW